MPIGHQTCLGEFGGTAAVTEVPPSDYFNGQKRRINIEIKKWIQMVLIWTYDGNFFKSWIMIISRIYKEIPIKNGDFPVRYIKSP